MRGAVLLAAALTLGACAAPNGPPPELEGALPAGLSTPQTVQFTNGCYGYLTTGGAVQLRDAGGQRVCDP